ncbi:MAG: TolC family protein [Planctomycetes bacterium]|nr:TolC family protein [Planctomycetota bacterium]
MRNYIFILLMLSLLFAGCAEQNTSVLKQEISYSFNEHPEETASAPSNMPGPEITGITEPDDALTLGQVLALTLMNNPELKVFSLETRAAQARVLQAGLWPNPELEVEVENVGGSGEVSGFDASETTIVISQLIEMGNKSQKRKKIASFEKELAGIDHQDKKLEVFSGAATAFIAVLEAQEKLQLSNELLKLSEKSFDTVERRVSAGKDSPLEKTRASVALSNIRIQHSKTQRTLKYARKELASFWGQSKPLFEQATGNLNRVEQLPPLEDLIDQLKLNPQYSRWETEIKKSQAALDLEKSRATGDVTIGAGFRRSNETDDNTVVFGFSIPLMVSDRNQGAKREAVYNLAKSRQQQRAAWLKLLNEFNRTYHDFANSFSLATSLKNDVLPGAMKMFDAAARAYQEGKVDYLNVLDAQRTLFNVKNEYVESLAAYHTARTDIERFIGSTAETINISESEE